MNKEKKLVEKEEVINLAKRTQRYCDLLAEQCDNWQDPPKVGAIIGQKREKGGKKKGIIVIGLLLAFACLFPVLAQAQDVDSLYVQFSQSKGQQHLRHANEIAQRLSDLGHINAVKPFTESDDVVATDAFVYGAMALFKADHADYAEGILYNRKSIDLFRQLKDSTRIVYKLQNLYVVYTATGQYDKALACLQESLTIATAINDRSMIANTLLSLGSLHSHKGNNLLAIESIQKGLAIERELNNTRKIIWALTSLATLYLDLDKIDEAEQYVDEASDLSAKDSIVNMQLECWVAKSEIHKKKREWNRAIAYLDTALIASQENDFDEFVSMSLFNLGDIYMLSGKNPDKAADYFIRSIEVSEKVERRQDVQNAYYKLYQLRRKTAPVLALEYLEKSIEIEEELDKEAMQEQLANFHVQYETQEKQFEIERQQAVINHDKGLRLFLILGLVCSLLILILTSLVLRYRTKRNHILMEMNATKDKFFTIISHDLKNPVIAQRNALQSLINNAETLDKDALAIYYSELLKSADGQVELLYNLLGWAQLQTRRVVCKPDVFNLYPVVVGDICKLMTSLLNEKKLEIKFDLPDEMLVFADRNMLMTVVRNLVSNAIKFSYRGGEIQLQAEDAGKFWLMSVRDFGTGMSPEKRDRLFLLDSPSVRGTEGEQGSGLGLIVCKEMIEQNGGTLTVESEEGKGSTFRFTVKKG